VFSRATTILPSFGAVSIGFHSLMAASPMPRRRYRPMRRRRWRKARDGEQRAMGRAQAHVRCPDFVLLQIAGAIEVFGGWMAPSHRITATTPSNTMEADSDMATKAPTNQ
jgi:hypothetical protein